MRGGMRGVVVPVLVAAAMLALAIGMVSAPLARAAGPAAYTVVNTNDSGMGSLRDAITQSNANDPGLGNHNTITFDSTVFPVGTPTMISLTSDTLTLTRDVTITGPGSGSLTVARDTAVGTPQFGIFAVPSGVTATISGLTITGGNWGGDGGGISNQGALALTGVVVTGNQAGNNGGGIENNTSGTVTLTNVTVSGNTAGGNGGGINTFDSTLIATNTTVSGNTAGFYGGGIEVFGSGPGQTGGMATLTNVTIAGNTAIGNDGGGIDTAGTLTLVNLTVTGNTAQTGGGLNNVGGTVSVTRTIIVGNTGGDFGGSGINGANVSNLTTGAPLLAPLGNYGGSTRTQPPLPGSPAIDAGGTDCTGADQRGVTRPRGAACDIGAVESVGFTFAMPTGSGQSTPITTGFTTPLGVTVTGNAVPGAGGITEPVNGGVVTFTGPMTGASIATNPTTATIMNGRASGSVAANGMPGGPYTVTASASGTTGSATYALMNTQAPAITSASSATVTFGQAASFTVTATGYPAPALTEMGTLPSGVTFVDNANGTATLSGTPTTAGTFTVTLTAHNGVGMDATQSFTLTVNQAPAITSASSATVTFGQAASFTVTATGYPAPTFSATGLPGGVTLNMTTGALSGTPTTAGAFMVTLTAANGTLPAATQMFTLTVTKATPSVIVTSGSAMNTSVVGTSVTFTATVAGVNGTAPTGTVTFTSSDGTPLPAATQSTMGANLIATVTTSALTVGSDTLTAHYSGDTNYLMAGGSVMQTVRAARVTGLTVTATGSGNSGTATMPMLKPGASFTLAVTGSYNNGTMGSVSPVMYTVTSGGNAVSVSADGTVTGIAAGTAVITVSGPDGTSATITVTVNGGTGAGLTNPQPMTHVTPAVVTAAATPLPQPNRAPGGSGSGSSQPHSPGSPTPIPAVQPPRH